jgi:hypothetical protein
MDWWNLLVEITGGTYWWKLLVGGNYWWKLLAGGNYCWKLLAEIGALLEIASRWRLGPLGTLPEIGVLV